MGVVYGLSLAFGTVLLGWAHTHTDEIPFMLGCVLIVSFVIGLIFPKRWLMTWATLGGSLFTAEVMVHFGILHAPYPPGAGLPWPALIAYIPAGIGAGIAARR